MYILLYAQAGDGVHKWTHYGDCGDTEMSCKKSKYFFFLQFHYSLAADSL